ncbi:MAG: polysaccharide biosynthesis C-terminal domain-containing protein, partial [Verrucomicrobia bacterium]|nr:polysaccharide biosynthesis C-terminal domain-containing protein [Verrucomicrobiota bacterium]
GKPVLRLMFPAAPQGGELFWIGSMAVVFYSLSYIAGGVLNGLGKSHISMIHAGIGVVVTSLWNVFGILVLHWGIYTLAVNAILFSALIMILNLRSAMKFCEVKINYLKLFFGPLICSLIMGVGCIVCYLLFFAITGSNAATSVSALS